MSRLDSFIRRMQAQRICINFAARRGNLPEGPIFEFGLGNGRTYDHLRTSFGSREIFVFDRKVDAHPACVPDADHLFLGEITEMLPRVAPRFRGRVAFVHLDISTGDDALDRVLTRALAPLITDIAAPGGLAASDQPLPLTGWEPVPMSPRIPNNRYFLYRRPAVSARLTAAKRKAAPSAEKDAAAWG